LKLSHRFGHAKPPPPSSSSRALELNLSLVEFTTPAQIARPPRQTYVNDHLGVRKSLLANRIRIYALEFQLRPLLVTEPEFDDLAGTVNGDQSLGVEPSGHVRGSRLLRADASGCHTRS